MLPGHLVEEFWESVARALTSNPPSGSDRRRIDQAIKLYRGVISERGADDAVYHWEPSDVARSILEGGFLDSVPACP